MITKNGTVMVLMIGQDVEKLLKLIMTHALEGVGIDLTGRRKGIFMKKIIFLTLLIISSITIADECGQYCVDVCRPEYLENVKSCKDSNCIQNAVNKHQQCASQCRIRECSNQQCIHNCQWTFKNKFEYCTTFVHNYKGCIDLGRVDLDICMSSCRMF